MKKTKTQKGITLVALIITIVVLLVLAVVAIQEIVGDGIITYATTAMENQKIAQIKEEAELVKTEAQAEYFLSGKTLDQAELLRLINEHFEGSTIEGNAVILKDGKYKITIDANKNMVVGKTEEDGNGEGTAVRGDVKLSSEVSAGKIKLIIELVGIPALNEEMAIAFFEKDCLPGTSTEDLMKRVGKEYTGEEMEAEAVYDAMFKSEFDNISYQEFMANKDAIVQEKMNMPTADIAMKIFILQKTAGEYLEGEFQYGMLIEYSRQLLPELVGKEETEIGSIVEEWYNKEYTFEEIVTNIMTEQFGVATVDEAVTILNTYSGLAEEEYMFSRNEMLIYIAAQAYGETYAESHPIIIELPDGTTKTIEWFMNENLSYNYNASQIGNYTFKVTGPSGNTKEETVIVGGVKLDKTKIEKGIIEGEEVTETLTASLINIEGEITWTTSDENIATIEGTGTTVNVLLKSLGEATITAKCGEYSAICKVIGERYNLAVIVPTIAATGNFANNPNIAEVREGNVPIPKGYTYVKGNVDGGVVIKDSSGNEWVWVPAAVSEISEVVNGENVGKLYDFSTTGATAKAYPTTSNSGNREPDVVTGASTGSDSTTGTSRDGDTDNLSIVLEGEYANTQTAASFKAQLQAEFDNMIESVSKYGGYYIGRYEAGGTINSPVLKQGATVIRNTSNSSNWYYMYTSAKKLAANESVTTGMIWGCQWDNTLRWLVNSNNLGWSDLKDSRKWGNYKNSTGNAVTNSGTGRSAGYSEYWKAGNIYDLAGNYWDWTLEAYDTYYRVSRGGYYNAYGNDFPASGRGNGIPAGSSGSNTFRPTLIIE